MVVDCRSADGFWVGYWELVDVRVSIDLEIYFFLLDAFNARGLTPLFGARDIEPGGEGTDLSE